LSAVALITAPRVIQYVAKSKSQSAAIQLENVVGAVELFFLENGVYPTQQQGLDALVSKPIGVGAWDGPYLRDARGLVDPWGRPYLYRIPGTDGQPFDVYSLGADGVEGGDGENQDLRS
ncbi:MAG: type II secretion system major pseudopilin GspG, partial [Pseudomonadota bacterium]